MSAAEKHAPGYVPNADYTQEDWDEVSDNPELSDEQLAGMKPLDEAMPDLAAAIRRTRGPQRTPTKRLVSLRLDPRVIDHFRASGEGWQTRMGDVLKKAAGL